LAIFSIFSRPGEAETVLVPDRFSWFAALLPPVYALTHGLWLTLVAIVAAIALLIVAAPWIGSDAATALYILGAIFFGFEAATLRRVALGRRRYVHRAERLAPSAEAAEVGWLSRDTRAR